MGKNGNFEQLNLSESKRRGSLILFAPESERPTVTLLLLPLLRTWCYILHFTLQTSNRTESEQSLFLDFWCKVVDSVVSAGE